jgi:hypothetical protein
MASVSKYWQVRCVAIIAASFLVFSRTGAYAGSSTSPPSTNPVLSENQVHVGGEYLMAFTVVMAYIENNMPKLSRTEKTG